LDDPLIYARAVHFAATISVAGVVFFIVFIAESAFAEAEMTDIPAIARGRLRWIAWIGLLLTILSGAAWFLLVAQSISDRPLSDLFSEGILWTVLWQTGFGRAWLLRLVLACVLAATFVRLLPNRGRPSASVKLAGVVLAAGLAGALAWAGHAVGAPGIEGDIHPAADVLHLVAAAAWLGALVPLALVLAAAGRDAASIAIARTTAARFSTLGIASVGTLLLTGVINTLYLAGSVAALSDTDYGHLLLIKAALFLGMVAIAAVNRLRLTPRLLADTSLRAAQDTLCQLRRNVAIEVATGVIIIAVVAVLGVTPPGLDEAVLPQGHRHHAH